MGEKRGRVEGGRRVHAGMRRTLREEGRTVLGHEGLDVGEERRLAEDGRGEQILLGRGAHAVHAVVKSRSGVVAEEVQREGGGVVKGFGRIHGRKGGMQIPVGLMETRIGASRILQVRHFITG